MCILLNKPPCVCTRIGDEMLNKITDKEIEDFKDLLKELSFWAGEKFAIDYSYKVDEKRVETAGGILGGAVGSAGQFFRFAGKSGANILCGCTRRGRCRWAGLCLPIGAGCYYAPWHRGLFRTHWVYPKIACSRHRHYRGGQAGYSNFAGKRSRRGGTGG